MKFKFKIQILIFFIVLLLFFIFELLAPDEIKWDKTYSRTDKQPYGSYALYHLLPDLFPGCTISTARYSYFESLRDEEENKTAILIITNSFEPDSFDFYYLEKFVKQGNQVFIAANSFGIQMEKEYKVFAKTPDISTGFLKNDSIYSEFLNPVLAKSGKNSYSADYDYSVFTSFDTLKTIVLGCRNNQKADLLKINDCKGSWILSSSPHAFTNYYLVFRKKTDYPSGILSYIGSDKRKIIWDEYFKPGKTIDSTPLRYILNRTSLRHAYFLLIFTLLIYILIRAKRRQRAIPVIQSLPNTSKEFIETIGRFYYSHKGHRDIALKKFSYFLDYIRSFYYLNTSEETNVLVQKISQKSGIEKDDIHKIFMAAGIISKSKQIDGNTLAAFNQLIENFYKHSI